MDKQSSIVENIKHSFKYLFSPGYLIYMLLMVMSLSGTTLITNGTSRFLNIIPLIILICFLYRSLDSAQNIYENDTESYFSLATCLTFWEFLKFVTANFIVILSLVIVFGLLFYGLFTGQSMEGQEISLTLYIYLIVTSALFMLITPAILVTFFLNNNFLETINPIRWLIIVSKFGRDRFLLMATIIFLSYIFISCLSYFSSHFGQIESRIINSALVTIYLGFSYIFVGYCSRGLLKEELTDKSEEDADVDIRMAKDAWDTGHHENAIESLLRTFNNCPNWHRKKRIALKLFSYYDAMGKSEQKKTLIDSIIHQVAMREQENYTYAKSFIYEKIKNNEEIDMGLVHPLATLADKDGDPKLALKLMNGFFEKYPSHPKLSDLYYIKVRSLKKLRKSEEAFTTLKQLLKDHPNLKENPDIKSLISELKLTLKAKQARAEAQKSKQGSS